MNGRRSFPLGWVLVTIALVVIVGGIAYFLGVATAHPVVTDHMRLFRIFAHRPGGFLGFGGLGFWLLVLLIAIGVGLLVAAIVRPSRRGETFEEWHRREHGQGPSGTGGGEPPATPPTSALGQAPGGSSPGTSADPTGGTKPD